MRPNNPFDLGYYSSEELSEFGFKFVGNNVLIAKNCNIIGLDNITIGNNVRIDAFSSLIATNDVGIHIGSHVHIASSCLLSGGGGIVLSDFSGLSSGVCIYSQSDDYSGNFLTNPTIPKEFTRIERRTVYLGKHVIVGARSVLLPGVKIGEGTAVGSLSLVTKSLNSWSVYFGAPAKKLKNRSKKILDLERSLLNL